MMRHVHFGAGALGLGLICAQHRKRSPELYILNRDGPASKERIAAIADKGGYQLVPFLTKPQFIPVKRALTYSAANWEAIGDCDGPMLITTALKKDGIDASMPQIKQLLAARRGKKTFVVAGENQVDSHYIRDRLAGTRILADPGIVFQRAVVDRICNKPVLKDGIVSVSHEQFGQVYLETQRPKISKALLPSTKNWRHVQNFEYTVDRKKWVVNATHLMISLVAHYHKFPSVCDFVSASNANERLLRVMIEESAEALSNNYRSKNKQIGESDTDFKKFCDMLFERIKIYPQRIYDGVTRFTGPAKLTSFMDDFHRKISDPHLALLISSRSFVAYSPALISSMVFEMVTKRRWIR
jgi:hypothetical protein